MNTPEKFEKVDADIIRPDYFADAQKSADNDAHIIITGPELVPQGKRFGDWSQVTK